MNNWSQHTLAIVQGGFLLSMALVAVAFGSAIAAEQLQHRVKPTWPLPGGWVGATFFFALAIVPFHMSFSRFGWLPWGLISPQGTVVYAIAATVCNATLVRWWRFGFGEIQRKEHR